MVKGTHPILGKYVYLYIHKTLRICKLRRIWRQNGLSDPKKPKCRWTDMSVGQRSAYFFWSRSFLGPDLDVFGGGKIKFSKRGKR